MATQRGRPKAFLCLSGQYCEARPLFPSKKTMVYLVYFCHLSNKYLP